MQPSQAAHDGSTVGITLHRGGALTTFLPFSLPEVLEQEAEDRKQRRINRLRRESRLPSGKTWETFEYDRAPLTLRQQLDHLAQG